MNRIHDWVDGRKNIAHLYLYEIDKNLKGENWQMELSVVEETINAYKRNIPYPGVLCVKTGHRLTKARITATVFKNCEQNITGGIFPLLSDWGYLQNESKNLQWNANGAC